MTCCRQPQQSRVESLALERGRLGGPFATQAAGSDVLSEPVACGYSDHTTDLPLKDITERHFTVSPSNNLLFPLHKSAPCQTLHQI